MATGLVGTLFLPEQLRDYAAIRAAGVTATLTIGPWIHAEPGEIRATSQEDVAWLSHHLLGTALPERAPVHVYLQQVWATRPEFDQWPPPPGAVATSYYLRTAGRLSVESEPGDPLPAWFIYDPADLDALGRMAWSYAAAWQVVRTTPRSNPGPTFFIYTTDVLDAAQDLIGPVSARIFVRTETEYADVFVRLCDVDEKGRVAEHCRRDPAAQPGKPCPPPMYRSTRTEFLPSISSLFPTAYRVHAAPGYRLQMTGGAFLVTPRNFGTAEPFGSVTTAGGCTPVGDRFDCRSACSRSSSCRSHR